MTERACCHLPVRQPDFHDSRYSRHGARRVPARVEGRIGRHSLRHEEQVGRRGPPLEVVPTLGVAGV